MDLARGGIVRQRRAARKNERPTDSELIQIPNLQAPRSRLE